MLNERSSKEGQITEEGLKKLREMKGTKLRLGMMQNNELVCEETLRKFVNGLGDTNPLWQDKEYSKNTRYGALVAPPSWLYSVFGAGIMHGLTGVHSFHAGDDWEFHKPILLGDKIRPEAIAQGYEEMKGSHFAARMIKQFQERRYYNQKDDLVAKALRWNMRTERSSVRETGKYKEVTLPHPWIDEELKRIEDEVLSEQIRGSKVRYWEDVSIGEELPQLVKGPHSFENELAWHAGATGFWVSSNVALRLYRKHPAWAYRDLESMALEPMASVHWLKAAAHKAGLPYPYAVGMEINAWLIQFLTDWIGDEGWLKRCYAEYRAFVYVSDVLWFKGRVINKNVDENGEYFIDIETSGINQRGENVIPGKATVILPSKEARTFPVEKRLPGSK
jgi:acyl dehydratase